MKTPLLTLTATAAMFFVASSAFAANSRSAPNHPSYHHIENDGSDYSAVSNAVPFAVGPTSQDDGNPGVLPQPAGPAWTPYLTTTINGSDTYPDIWVTLSANTHIATATTSAVPPVDPRLLSNQAFVQVRLLVDGVPVPFAGTSNINVNIDSVMNEIFDATLKAFFQEISMKSLTWSVPAVGAGPHRLEVDTRFWFHPSEVSSSLAMRAVFGPANLTAQSVHLN